MLLLVGILGGNVGGSVGVRVRACVSSKRGKFQFLLVTFLLINTLTICDLFSSARKNVRPRDAKGNITRSPP